MFLVMKTFVVAVGLKLDIKSIFINFYPKILSIAGIGYSFINIYVIYTKYTDAVFVPAYMDAFY
jgi:hypothetical protein